MDIQEQLKTLPDLPGSYQYYDKNNEIIYVGKAKNLKKRVLSYFHKTLDTPKLRVLVPQIVRIEFIITNTEVEALILESHLIKKYKPKYNVLLKDDKKYPYFVITDEDYPRVIVARKGNRNPIKGKYFGPYTDSRAMYATLDLLKKIFPLKQCKTPKFRSRPCMYYDIGRCCAPCQKMVSVEDYKKILNKVELFLSGKKGELIAELKKEMQKCSDNFEYEKAAKYRDSYLDIEKTLETQRVVFENTNKNQDIIAFLNEGTLFGFTLLQIREGRLIDKREFSFDFSTLDNYSEVIEFFLKEYYELLSNIDFPDEIIINYQLEDDTIKLYNEWLSSKAKKHVKIIKGTTKKYEDLKTLGIKNAKSYMEKLKQKKLNEIQTDYNEIGSYIMEKLCLRKFPSLVECFDISHIQGTNTVASMVVFENGIKKKSAYRKFKIKTVVDKPDDFASMSEVVQRRYSKLLKNNEKFPDLIIIDGGKGQLSSVMNIFDELGIKNQDIVSLAKREEEVFLPHQKDSVIFPRNSKALYFFQQIRDEAHRFAITFHRDLRGKSSVKSVFDEIKGCSNKSKELLLKAFKSVEIIKTKTQEELSLVVNKRTAKAVFEYFQDVKT